MGQDRCRDAFGRKNPAHDRPASRRARARKFLRRCILGIVPAAPQALCPPSGGAEKDLAFPCDIDPPLDVPGFFALTPEALEALYPTPNGYSDNPFFKWLTQAKDRAIFQRKPYSNITVALSILARINLDAIAIEFRAGIPFSHGMSVRTRFAPSPTGFLHVGGARTALFNWLYARQNNGTFILRIEDTDAARNTDEAYKVIYDGLSWLGLDWDEGPDKGGPFGPYQQSERNGIYEKYLARLEAGGHVYEDNGAIRFRSPRKQVVVEDIVCGRIEFDMSNPATHPDMTIRRPDGSWIFHFVNVVDDIEMQLTHVIRGEDHLSNTPKHIELYQALGATPPKFAHIPLILNHEGKKLSKRDGGSSITYFLDLGYTPEAVANYLCLLGWSPGENREFLKIAEILGLFDLGQINRRNSIFDLDKCFWLNGQHIQHMSHERFEELALPFVDRAGIAYGTRDALRPALAIVKPKVKHLSDVPDWIGFLFTEEYPFEPEAVAKSLAKPGASDRLKSLGDALAGLADWSHPAIELKLKETAAALGAKAGELVHPARVAVSGRSVGPGLYEMFEVLGKTRTLARFEKARALAS